VMHLVSDALILSLSILPFRGWMMRAWRSVGRHASLEPLVSALHIVYLPQLQTSHVLCTNISRVVGIADATSACACQVGGERCEKLTSSTTRLPEYRATQAVVTSRRYSTVTCACNSGVALLMPPTWQERWRHGSRKDKTR
jgi:hypothetical protein